MVSKYLIYGLVDPITKELRYVGKSCSGLKRPRDHTKPGELKYDTHKVNWIKAVLSEGGKPEIVILEEFDNPEILDSAEQKWIAYHRSIGANLTNSDAGGTGSLGRRHKNISKEKLSKKRKERNNRLNEIYGFIPGILRKYHIYTEQGELKQCSSCKEWLFLADFYKSKNTWDELQYICKKDDAETRRKYKRSYKRITTDEQLAELRQRKVENMNKSLTPQKRKVLASQPIVCINIETGAIKRYASAKDAKVDGFHPTKISTAIKNEIPYKGHRFAKACPDAEIHLKILTDVIKINAKAVLLAELAGMQKEMGLSDEQVKDFMASDDFQDILKDYS